MIEEPFTWEQEPEPEAAPVAVDGEWAKVYDDAAQQVMLTAPEQGPEVRPYAVAEQTRRAVSIAQARLSAEMSEHAAALADAREQITQVEQGLTSAQEAADQAAADAATALGPVAVSRLVVPPGESGIGAALIEDGAVTAPKLYATSEMWAKMLTVAGDATIGGNLVVDNSLDVTKIRAESFAGYEVSGARIVSPFAGGNITVADGTIALYRTTGAGDEYTSLSLGGPGADQVTLVPAPGREATVSINGADGSAGFEGPLSAPDVILDGDSLLGTLAGVRRGIIGATWGSGASLPDVGSGSYGLVRFTWRIVQNRWYRFAADVKVQGTGAHVIQFTLHHSAAAGPATIGSAVVAVWYYQIPSSGVGAVHLERVFRGGYTYDGYNMLLSMRSVSGSAVRLWNDGGSEQSQSFFVVEDMGAATYEAGAEWTGGGGTPYGGVTAPTAPAPTKRTYTRTYAAQGIRSWRGGSQVTDVLHHGYFGGYQRYSQLLFPATVVSDLAGATLKRARLKLSNMLTYYGAGMTVFVSSWSDTSLASTPRTSGASTQIAWSRGQTKFETIPWAAGRRSVWLGIGAGSSAQNYGKFRYDPAACVLELTYEK